MKICVIEDEERLAKALCQGLNNFGYKTEYFLDGKKGYDHVELHHQDYDLAIIDLMLPKKSGLEICQSLRERKSTLPILILSARGAVTDKTSLLRSGADDYLTKPFSFEELGARIEAILRRPRASLSVELRSGKLSVDITNRKAYYQNNEIILSLKEFALLEYFIRNPNRIITRDQLLSNLWDFRSFSNVIDVHIKNLRKKLETYSGEKILETVWGVGYRLKQ
jgi:DNA-binding response OmpR family regulator